MKATILAAVLAASALGCGAPAGAQSAPPSMAAHDGHMMGTTMPHCASGDSVVMVDMKAKTYAVFDPTHDTSMQTDAATMKAHHEEMMCKSKAMQMGATAAKHAM